MPSPKIRNRPPLLEELQGLVPVRGLPEKFLKVLIRHSDVLPAPKGAHVRQNGNDLKFFLFLLKGSLLLRDLSGEAERIEQGSVRAGFPLVAEGKGPIDAECTRNCELLRLPIKALKTLRSLAEQEAAIAESEADKSDEEQLEDRIKNDFRDAIKSGKLQLPGMPEVAARISSHIDSPQSTSASIARIIQTDPAITARLLQVSNSVAFGARAPVKTCRDAVTRLGRNATRELVTSFVLKGLFHTRSSDIKNRMQELWRHSTEVAALCHVLARRVSGMEPERAMLIGLVHDIGVIPILTRAHRYEGLAQDTALLDRVIADLRGEIGALTMREWAFGDEFIDAAQNAENWFRDGPQEPDYTDLLLIAQLHAFLGKPQAQSMPRIDQVPAFGKLALGELSPGMSLLILDEARQEIDEVQMMLS